MVRAWGVAWTAYNMSKCEHGERITRFCTAQHCRHKEAGGCEYCVKKHHFHLTNAALLNEQHLEAIVRALTLPHDTRFKSKTLQELACEYLRVVRHACGNWLEQAQVTVAERLSFPLLRREGHLATYQRIRSKDYKHINAQDLRAIHDFALASADLLRKQQLAAYFAEVQQVSAIVRAAEGLAQALSALPALGLPEQPMAAPAVGQRLSETIAEVLREKSRLQGMGRGEREVLVGKTQSLKLQQLMKESSLLKNRISRELSLKQGKQDKKRGSTPGKELMLDAINKRHSNNAITKQTMASPKKETFELPPINDATEERKKRNRRASIDDKLEMKFGLVHRQSQGKELQHKRKLILDTVFANEEVEHLQNGAIPAPPLPLPVIEHTEVRNKVVKIPIVHGQQSFDEEIQSPIFKNKRKQKHNAQAPLKELPLTEVPEVQREDSEREIPLKNAKDHSEEEIVLEANQKYSLLLFSQALRSDGERAIVLLTAALKYSPNNLSAAQYLSYLYLQGGHAKECLQVCESILVKIEDRAQEFQVTLHLHNNRAAALNMLGRYSESIVVLEKCLKFRRKHYFYKNLADAYFSLGIPEKAAMNYEKAVRLDPAYDEAYYNLAVCEFMQSEYISAQLNIEQALHIDPKNDTYIELKSQIANRIANCAE